MTSVERRKIPLAEAGDLLAPGKPLPFKIMDREGRLLLAVGQRILDARQLNALFERGACIEYEEVVQLRKARQAGAAIIATGGTGSSTRTRTWFDRREQQVWALDGLLRHFGRAPDLAAQLEAFCEGYIGLIQNHLDAALYTCIRQDEHRFALYPLTHALHTATVALATARQLEWPAEQQRTAVRAALTMNASIVELQARMAEQEDPATKRQLEQIRAHPHQSAQMLRECGVSDAQWLAAVEDHHERASGTGYPRGISEFSEIAHVLRAADVFVAKISPRSARQPLTPQVAARQLYEEEQGGPIGGALIKAVGIYPPGDFVLLKNGEAAIVVQRASGSQAAVVAALRGANGKAIAGAPKRDTADANFAIAGHLPDRSGLPRLLPEVLYGLFDD